MSPERSLREILNSGVGNPSRRFDNSSNRQPSEWPKRNPHIVEKIKADRQEAQRRLEAVQARSTHS